MTCGSSRKFPEAAGLDADLVRRLNQPLALDNLGLVERTAAAGTGEPATKASEKVDPTIIPDLIRAHFTLTPRGIIDSLNLRRPIYCKTAAYGHFGRTDPDFTWEATDKSHKLASDAGLKHEPVGHAVRK